MAKYFLGYFSNGYCGCDEAHGFIAEDKEQVLKHCEDMLPEYADDSIVGCLDEDEQQDEDAMEAYYAECFVEVEEVSEEKMREEMDDEEPFIL